jgi:hypothetical protein
MESVLSIIIRNHGHQGILEEIKWENVKNVEQLFHRLRRVDNGQTPIQNWKKNPVRNRPFRLSKVQEALPRGTKQEDNLGTPNTAQKRQKKPQVKPMWVEKA